MVANSLGVEVDDRLPDRLPAGVARTVAPARAAPVRLAEPRLDPLPRDAWSAEVRALLDPDGSGGPVLNLYATLAPPSRALSPARRAVGLHPDPAPRSRGEPASC